MARRAQAKKNSATTGSTPRTRARTASHSGRDSLAKLRAHVDALEKRLKRADSLTRKSVKALQASYEALYEAHAGQTPSSEMQRQLQALSQRLTDMIEQTRRDMAHDLKVVLEDPRIETLGQALSRANKRLQQAEQKQAEAVNTINAHIARLAEAVDKRIERETRDRQAADTALGERLDKVEKVSAEAIQSLGDKVIQVADELQDRVKHLKGELAEEAILRQQNYEEHKFEMARRIEALEEDQRNTIPAFERQLERLASRVELLEQKPVMVAETFAQKDIQPAFVPEAVPEPCERKDDVGVSDYTQADAPDAFAPQMSRESVAVSPPDFQLGQEKLASSASPQPYLAESGSQAYEAYAPVEYAASGTQEQMSTGFQPRAWVPGAGSGDNVSAGPSPDASLTPAKTPTQQGPTTYAPPEPVPYQGPDQGPASSGQTVAGNVYNLNPAPPPPPMPQAAPDVPSIEQVEPTMESARPGVTPDAKSRKGGRKRVKASKGARPSTLKRTLLMAAAAVVLVFAAKTFVPRFLGAETSTGASAPTSIADSHTQENKVSPNEPVVAGQDMSPDAVPAEPARRVETVAPKGDYSKGMTAPDLGKGQVAQSHEKTLEAAAKAGDPIAQFQLGLARLEAGDESEAVRLMRLSAAQGQPAAQYRLAKMYEAGLGVEVNTRTAKSLLLKAAKAGNRLAMHDLGHYYATGADGEAEDLVKAAGWFTQAAEHGVVDSQYNLGILYQGGSSIPKDLESAWFWFKVAAAQGDRDAARQAEAVAIDMSPEQMARAQARLMAFAPKPINNAANGIFTNLPWMNKAAKASVQKGESVKTAQSLLQKLGYNVGRPDGALGPKTRNAIISFERANGLPQTGRVNADLIERLKLAAGA